MEHRENYRRRGSYRQKQCRFHPEKLMDCLWPNPLLSRSPPAHGPARPELLRGPAACNGDNMRPAREDRCGGATRVSRCPAADSGGARRPGPVQNGAARHGYAHQMVLVCRAGLRGTWLRQGQRAALRAGPGPAQALQQQPWPAYHSEAQAPLLLPAQEAKFPLLSQHSTLWFACPDKKLPLRPSVPAPDAPAVPDRRLLRQNRGRGPQDEFRDLKARVVFRSQPAAHRCALWPEHWHAAATWPAFPAPATPLPPR